MNNVIQSADFNEWRNKYESNFFHIYLDCKSPITLSGLQSVDRKDYSSFVHEYVHYIQHITTPYGIKYNNYFINRLIIFRGYLDSHQVVPLPIKIEEPQAARDFESELRKKNGCKDFSKGTIGAIELRTADLETARKNDTAVNILVYDDINDRIFEDGFGFGYWCVIEGMAHLIQSLIEPELRHPDVRYQATQLVCDEIRPDLKDDKRLLISICYTALFFDNPGLAFIDILRSTEVNEDGRELFKRYMTDYDRNFRGNTMPNWQMMNILMDGFLKHLEALLGTSSVYIRQVIDNLKDESSTGYSLLLILIYTEDLSDEKCLNRLLDFYGIPAIDSKNQDIVFPINPTTGKPFIETAALISLELIHARLTKSNGDTTCIRLPICDRVTRETEKELIDQNCEDTQWKKQLPCQFTVGLSYYRLSNKTFIDKA